MLARAQTAIEAAMADGDPSEVAELPLDTAELDAVVVVRWLDPEYGNAFIEAMAMALPVVLTPGAATGIGAANGQQFAVAETDEALAEAAERMEREALSVENRIKGTDVRLEGHLRVSTSEAVTLHLLPRWLAEFRDTYLGLTLDIASTNQIVDLSKREADVVIRGTDNPPPHLVGRRCGRIAFAAYASKRYLDKVGRDRPLADYEWLGFDGPMLRVQQAKWLAANIPESRVRRKRPVKAAIAEV